MTEKLIDAGVNLSSHQFLTDLPEIIARARAAQIDNMLVIGTDVDESAIALQLAEQYQLFASVGVHPHYACNVSDDFIAQLQRLAQSPWCKAIGECGLDFNRNLSSPTQQLSVFNAQLSLAKNLNMPVYMHERDASDELYHCIKEHAITGVVHCFTGNKQALERYLDLGLYIGITGWVCDERRGIPLQQLIQYIPDDRLLIETDAPYLIPRTIQPKPKKHRNEPAYLHYICDMIAHLKQCSTAHIAKATYANTQRLFNLGHDR
ncbi:TatD family hydrolase [Pseudoalteromonas ulvae]|uniref:Hydrolase TatD n=1 Tax=Pseudoalteromonas ulvae TaxID=107327 RepID=A0A244CWD8_PSEDV|nr:TatD family hydrolase [Pseudoalteromonas ulvae]OUL59746.1 hydrolase TatD [Pseudoalteromonas ulvae]